MVEEESYEKKVEIKEKPLGGTEVREAERVTDRSTAAQRGRAEKIAGKSGEIIGAGLKKASRVIKEFTSEFSKQMKSSETPKQAGPTQRTEYRSEQTRVQEAPPSMVVEKAEEKVTKEE